MRQDCKHFESRTYDNGETVRKCHLDLAPDAPWRCPDDCQAYAPRIADVAWIHGKLVTPPTPPEPPLEHAAELLDAAEEVLNDAGPRILAELAAERERKQKRGRRRFRRR